MAALWFIEAQKDEAWNDASHAFTDWLVETQSPSTLEPFGFSEGDELAHNGLSFFVFAFPADMARRSRCLASGRKLPDGDSAGLMVDSYTSLVEAPSCCHPIR